MLFMKRIYLAGMAVLINTILLAQDKSPDVNVKIEKDNGGSFWGMPWVWVVGAAIFILLLVALLRGRSRE